MGYTFTYPYVLPPGFGGVPAVALDSGNNLWVFQRADPGKPQLFKFDANAKLIMQVGPDVIGYQDKAHGMAVDADDNVWITAANSATVMKISPLSGVESPASKPKSAPVFATWVKWKNPSNTGTDS